MPATILMHPRLDADAGTREQLTERLADLLAHEQLLRWQAVPESEANYWRLFGDLETGQAIPRAGGVEQRAARRTQACMQEARVRRARPSLAGDARAEFIARHRYLVRRLHPHFDEQAASRAHLWAMVRRACRDGDLIQLRECAAAVDTEEGRSAGLPEPALRSALRGAQARIRRLECHFPLNLRDAMADPEWVANRRAALRRRLPAQVQARG